MLERIFGSRAGGCALVGKEKPDLCEEAARPGKENRELCGVRAATGKVLADLCEKMGSKVGENLSVPDYDLAQVEVSLSSEGTPPAQVEVSLSVRDGAKPARASPRL